MTEIRKIGHDRSGMPAELWDFVLKELPAADLRSCFSLSRLLHYLARPLVFTHITIHAGIPTWKTSFNEDCRAANIQLMRRRKLRNTEVLQRIADDTQIARIVERMTVRVHRHNEGTTFDLGVDMLSSKFKSLQVLALEGNHQNNSHDVEEQLRTWIGNAPRTLLHLSVSEYHIVWNTLPRVLSKLHELSLYDPPRLSEFGIVLGSCSQLRTLNIYTNSSVCEAEFHAVLSGAAPDSLPHLTSFRFVCGDDDDAFIQDQGPLTAFIQNKKGMRRVELQLTAAFIGIDDYTRFVDILAGLPQLEIVGLRLRGDSTFTHEHLRLLDERLPLRVSALLLVWDFPDSDVPVRNWTAMLEKRHLLGYLHVLDITSMLLDLRDSLLKAHPPALQLVGWGTRLDWLQRDSPIDEAVYGAPWKDTTVAFRTVEDFGYEDWEWLLRSHLYSY
ncbi:hypothetical protein TRAPUB_6339 [Trametes pubescens]|uniref:F-box domain-containing protein n=1 Tax=Trametes pubescens TaxID=154538 RepID=A0A1M2V692_TRAPU|nr:hypothetical protein TRAPUB_6339 [Trametes pubescens]